MAKGFKKGTKHGGLGYRRDSLDQRDFKYEIPEHLRGVALTESVDMRPKCPPVYDQGQLGSCTSMAIGGAIEYDNLQQNPQNPWTPSRLFIYYNERVIENTVSTDAGAEIRDGIKSVMQTGICREVYWPYDISKFTNKPPKGAYNMAVPHRIQSYLSVNQTEVDIKTCLVEGFPVIFGFTVYDSFESDTVAKTGVVPMPAKTEQILGGHATVICGFTNSTRQFIVRNSWGTVWGLSGYFLMPFDYILSANLSSDFWIIKFVPGTPPGPQQ